MMLHAGGDFKTIAKFFGGQGTINVNSWAPDSKRFAFVEYQSMSSSRDSSSSAVKSARAPPSPSAPIHAACLRPV